MTKKLLFNALSKFTLGIFLVGLLLFGSAGTMRFWNGWLFLGILFIPMFLAGIWMLRKNPSLLQKRLNAKEKLHKQDTLIKLSGLMFVCGFTVAGLTFRFQRGMLPQRISIGAAVVFLCAYLLYAEVLRQNTYLSRTIEVQENQKMIDTGLYGIVRHPMYSASILLFLAMPLVLGSLYAFIIFLAYPVIIVQRIKSEEEFLAQELSGYRAYQDKVKYKLIPYLW